MSHICGGCGCSLPAEYADCDRNNKHKNTQEPTEKAVTKFELAHAGATIQRSDPYRADPDRTSLPETGIPVRALNANGSWDAVDIAHLDRESLDAWLRSRETIDWPVDVVMILLGHPRKETS